jgi:hypothetical protein
VVWEIGDILVSDEIIDIIDRIIADVSSFFPRVEKELVVSDR